MFVSQELYEAEVGIRAEEARKLRLEREAEKARREESKTRPWRWHVEAGMEGVFQSLLGWLLPSEATETVEVEEDSSERGSRQPAAVAVQAGESEWAERPLPYFGWSCYA